MHSDGRLTTFHEHGTSRHRSLWTLSGLRLVCHCGDRQACTADSLSAAHKEVFPTAYDRNEHGETPFIPAAQFLGKAPRRAPVQREFECG